MYERVSHGGGGIRFHRERFPFSTHKNAIRRCMTQIVVYLYAACNERRSGKTYSSRKIHLPPSADSYFTNEMIVRTTVDML